MTIKTKSPGFVWNRIKRDWNSNYFIFLIVWAVACFLFSKPINLVFSKLGSILFLSDIDSLKLYQGLIITIILSYYGIRLWQRKKIYGIKNPVLFLFTPLVIWYIINWLGLIKPTVTFLFFPCCRNFPFMFSILFVWIIDFIIGLCYYLTKEAAIRINQSSFIPDVALNTEAKDQKDLLGFDSFAQRIADEAMTISSSESVVFGINGEWGEGKTSMINMICKKLKGEKYQVVDFHPWKTNSGKAITQLFFDVLKDGLKDKIFGINWKIDRYAEALLHLEKSGFGKTIWQLFFSVDSVETQKDRIKECMTRLDKNVIIIVDDLDRLAKNEIADVLKLMRDTANFPNLVFIAAYDRYYLNEAIKSEINSHKADNYMDKIVLWEAPIYKPQPHKYLEVLKTLLKEKLSEYSTDIDEIFNYNQSKSLKAIHDMARRENKEPNNLENIETPHEILTSVFINIRTVKKFVNYFVFNLQIVKEKIVFKDIFYLSLLRCFFPKYYLIFIKSVHELYRNNNSNYGKINTEVKDYWNMIVHSDEINKDMISLIPKAIISELIDKSVHISTDSFTYYQNFPIYFYLGNYDEITISEFALMLKANDLSSFKDKVDVIISDGNIINQFGYDLVVHLLVKNIQGNDIDSFIKLFKELIWLSIKIDFSGFYNKVHDSMRLFDEYYYLEINALQSELKDFVVEENIQSNVQYLFTKIIERKRAVNFENFYFSSKDAIEISKENFKQLLGTSVGIDFQTIGIYYCCYKKINENGSLINDDEVINLMKIQARKYPDDFIKFLILKDSTIPYEKDIYSHRFNEFLLTIFTDLADLKGFLKIENFNIEKSRAKAYLKYALNQGFVDGNISQTKPFEPDIKDNKELFSNLYTINDLVEWKKSLELEAFKKNRNQ